MCPFFATLRGITLRNLRVAVLAIAHYAHWGYDEILDMDWDEFTAFLSEIPKEPTF